MSRQLHALSRFATVAIGIVGVSLSSAAAFAVTPISVRLTTGSDDLRGGNSAFIKLNLIDGTSTAERRLGGGFGQNSVVCRRVIFAETVPLEQIKSITIRHDGAPRPGHPFDTYENWDLQTLSVSQGNSCTQPANIYNSANDAPRESFVQRFTGRIRQIVLFRQFL